MAIQRRPKQGKDKNGQVKWVVRYRDPAGKEHSKSFSTEKAAKAEDAKQIQALTQGTWQDPARQKITVRQIFEEWMHDTPRR